MRTLSWILLSLFLTSGALLAQPQKASREPRLLRPQEVAVPVDEPTLQQQYATLASMSPEYVTYNEIGLVSEIKGASGIVIPQHRKLKQGDGAAEAVAKLKSVLLLTGTEVFTTKRNTLFEQDHERDIVLEQSISGIPVFAGWVIIRVNDDTGEMLSISARAIPDRGLPRTPKVPAEKAKGLAALYLEGSEWAEKNSVQVYGEPRLGYFAGTSKARKPTLIWSMTVSYITADHPPPASPGGLSKTIQVFVDAIDGQYLDQLSVRNESPTTVYSANYVNLNTGGYPQGLIRLFGDGQPQTDARGIAAYQNAGKAQSAWFNIFVEEIPWPLGIVVHWGSGPKAESGIVGGTWWISLQDGDSTYFPQGDVLDTVAHEFGHGIRRRYVNAVPTANEESASIDEAFADFSAVLTDVYQQPNFLTRPATWQLGEIFRSDPTRGVASWSSPKNSGAWWADWYPQRLIGLTADVHYNSTIMGLAYKLLSEGGTHPRAGQGGIPIIAVTPIGHLQAKSIFYRAMKQGAGMLTYPDFQTLRKATILAADQIYGSVGSTPTTQAWNAVGVTSCESPPKSPPGMTAGILDDFMCRGRYSISWPTVLSATTYHAQRVKAGYPWNLARDIVDGNVSSCSGSVSETTRFRLRACNECGCSAWQDLGDIQFYPQCP